MAKYVALLTSVFKLALWLSAKSLDTLELVWILSLLKKKSFEHIIDDGATLIDASRNGERKKNKTAVTMTTACISTHTLQLTLLSLFFQK